MPSYQFDHSEQSKALKWRLLKEGNFQALITTGQYFGERDSSIFKSGEELIDEILKIKDVKHY